jgi:hypothetical protein
MDVIRVLILTTLSSFSAYARLHPYNTTHCLALDTLCLAEPLHLADLKKI